ncbi:MAG: tetratricopeptide repeat protein [Treponema sp.]|nr:tetratricopeptide repeat protein [Treponema sp.]MCL2272146.1 tetratricopeptide repeat protein [Treponema sp.]
MKYLRVLIRCVIFSALVIFILCGCSSKPKNKGEIFALRNRAENMLALGNREASRGNYENAHAIFLESKRNAVLSDDPSAIIRCSLSLANNLYSLGRVDEAFIEWEKAVAEAENSKNTELLSVTRIFLARGRLFSGRTPAASVLEEVNRNQGYIKTDRLYIAFSWQVKALAQRALGAYSDAENSIRNSLEIHEKDMYLENASYDWYTLASIRSLAGNTQGALTALSSAILIDRRIENSWGLAASWRAVGDVSRKAGREKEALEAYSRARAIYEAIGNDFETAQIDQRMNQTTEDNNE